MFFKLGRRFINVACIVEISFHETDGAELILTTGAHHRMSLSDAEELQEVLEDMRPRKLKAFLGTCGVARSPELTPLEPANDGNPEPVLNAPTGPVSGDPPATPPRKKSTGKASKPAPSAPATQDPPVGDPAPQASADSQVQAGDGEPGDDKSAAE